MEARQLTLDDFDAVMEVTEEYGDFVDRWEKVFREGYLPGKTHRLFGSFKDNKLVSFVGCRLYFPFEYSWVLSALKVRPGLIWSENGIKESLLLLYESMENEGFTEYYSCMTEKRYHVFNRLFTKMVPEYYNRYSHKQFMRIEIGELPEEDHWLSIMGRVPAKEVLIIKKATLNVEL